jgi:ABC-type glycerol-3-phosphate transport system substrate-binding protein
MAPEPADRNRHAYTHRNVDPNNDSHQHSDRDPHPDTHSHGNQLDHTQQHTTADLYSHIHVYVHTAANQHVGANGNPYANSLGCNHPRDRIDELMQLKGIRSSFWVLLLALSACAPPGDSQATPTPTSSPSEGLPTQTGDQQAADSGAMLLTIWVPPGFDPGGGGLAAGMLHTRIGEFDSQHPELRVEVRVKAESGSGGLIESLLSAQEAAPLALPDLTLLPSPLLPVAAQGQLIRDYESISIAIEPDDWYPVAYDLIEWQGTAYGIPFVADAFVLAFRPTAVNTVPATWDTVLANERVLGFAAADPEALFTILQALALEDGVTQLPIENETLETVFDFYAAGNQNGTFPFWLTQYQNHEQSWQALSEGLVPMVASWSSKVITSQGDAISGSPLPTQSGEPFTMVKGWVWTISSPDEQRAGLAGELAEFLTAPEFMAQWSAAAGLLPLRQSSLSAWSPDERQALASVVIINAAAMPDQNTLDLWGDALSQAVVGLLKDELNVTEAIQVVNGLVADG